MLSRRGTILALGGAFLGGAAGRLDAGEYLAGRFAALEVESGGRLGIAVRDRGTGLLAGHRADERFPLCSTFKLLAAAAVLAKVDAGGERLDRHVPYGASDLVEYAPATQARVGEGGMPLGEICAAAVTLSDNTAGNLMLGAIGGPAGLTAFCRNLGDQVTRLDRTEPDLNEARPGDPRDTTSPAAMLGCLERLALGDALSDGSRALLLGWLSANTTGGARLRAGLPPGWQVGDKTGTGARGSTNDVGLIWPPQGDAILVAVYLTESDAPLERRNGVHAAVGRLLAEQR